MDKDEMSSTPSPQRPDDNEDEDSAETGWMPLAKVGLLLLLLVGSIALTSMTSMCSNRGIGKLFRRLDHRYGGDD